MKTICTKIEKLGSSFAYTFEGEGVYLSLSFTLPADFVVGSEYVVETHCGVFSQAMEENHWDSREKYLADERCTCGLLALLSPWKIETGTDASLVNIEWLTVAS